MAELAALPSAPGLPANESSKLQVQGSKCAEDRFAGQAGSPLFGKPEAEAETKPAPSAEERKA
jgi:hypothetical protein